MYFHEDDFGAVEVLPLKTWSHCAQQLGVIEEHSEKHRAPDGMGWTQCYLRPEGPCDLSELGLKLGDLQVVLDKYFAFEMKVETGYSSWREPCERMGAWLVEEYMALVVHWNEAGILLNLFAPGYDGVADENKQKLEEALSELAGKHELLLVDWYSASLFRLDDRNSLHTWLYNDMQ